MRQAMLDGILPSIQTHVLPTLTHTCAYTPRHAHLCTYRRAGKVIQLKKVKVDVFPKNDSL